MIAKLFTIALVIVSASVTVAAADDHCKAEGAPVFTIDVLDGAKVASSTKLYKTGAWTAGTSTGCADKALAAKVQTLVSAAPWKISHPIHCMIATSKSTNYYADGKLLFNERACNADKLDDVSENNLAEIVKIVTAAAQAVATGGSCKATGDIAFQIEHAAMPAAKVVTSMTRVYANGAWTFAETTADGKVGTAKAGCLDKDVQTRIDDDLKAAPWKVTTPRIRCMARSQTSVVYSVRGKIVFTKQVCGQVLDDDSAKKVEDIENVLAKLSP